MATDPKDLQRLSDDGASVRDWSTVSNVHGKPMSIGDVTLPDAGEQLALIKQLQQFVPSTKDMTTMEWSTISNVHHDK